MSANLYDRSLAFQAAELALREGEQAILAAALSGSAIGYDCAVANECPLHLPDTFINGASGRWIDSATATSGPMAGQPQYYIEYMGERTTSDDLGLGSDPNYGGSAGPTTAWYYRVTARSHDPSTATARAVAVVQSTVVRN